MLKKASLQVEQFQTCEGKAELLTSNTGVEITGENGR